jgi:hypothetical protein
MQKKPTHIQAHLIFAEPQANAENQKSLNFRQRSTEIERKTEKLK